MISLDRYSSTATATGSFPVSMYNPTSRPETSNSSSHQQAINKMENSDDSATPSMTIPIQRKWSASWNNDDDPNALSSSYKSQGPPSLPIRRETATDPSIFRSFLEEENIQDDNTTNHDDDDDTTSYVAEPGLGLGLENTTQHSSLDSVRIKASFPLTTMVDKLTLSSAMDIQTTSEGSMKNEQHQQSMMKKTDDSSLPQATSDAKFQQQHHYRNRECERRVATLMEDEEAMGMDVPPQCPVRLSTISCFRTVSDVNIELVHHLSSHRDEQQQVHFMNDPESFYPKPNDNSDNATFAEDSSEASNNNATERKKEMSVQPVSNKTKKKNTVTQKHDDDFEQIMLLTAPIEEIIIPEEGGELLSNSSHHGTSKPPRQPRRRSTLTSSTRLSTASSSSRQSATSFVSSCTFEDLAELDYNEEDDDDDDDDDDDNNGANPNNIGAYATGIAAKFGASPPPPKSFLNPTVLSPSQHSRIDSISHHSQLNAPIQPQRRSSYFLDDK